MYGILANPATSNPLSKNKSVEPRPSGSGFRPRFLPGAAPNHSVPNRGLVSGQVLRTIAFRSMLTVNFLFSRKDLETSVCGSQDRQKNDRQKNADHDLRSFCDSFFCHQFFCCMCSCQICAIWYYSRPAFQVSIKLVERVRKPATRPPTNIGSPIFGFPPSRRGT